MPTPDNKPYLLRLANRNIAISIRPKWVIEFAAQAKPITSNNPMPLSPSGVKPVQMELSPIVIKSPQPVSVVDPNTWFDNAGNKVNEPAINITNNQGAHILEKSATVENPYIATNTTIEPTASTMATNQKLLGYQLSCAGISNKNLTAVDDTVIMAAEITENITTFAQL